MAIGLGSRRLVLLVAFNIAGECDALFLPAARLARAPLSRVRSSPKCIASQEKDERETLGDEQSLQDLRSPEQLRSGIAGFYDSSSGVWERTWGEHMHHGYYPDGGRKDHQQAQIDMVEAVLDWSGCNYVPPKRFVDVGCGIGGSSRHIARKYGCTGEGITLSPKQAARAQHISDEAGLGDALKFQVADALDMPFPDNSFDLVWSLESGEHMPDKRKFVSELARVCKPGGRVIIVAWCHRDLREGESELLPREEQLLRRINRAYFLPRWCSVADYASLAREFGLAQIRTDDWTEKVKRFWPAVIASALRPRALLRLFRSGFTTFRGALVMPLMMRGQHRGLVKFGLLTATKPLPRPPVAWAVPSTSEGSTAPTELPSGADEETPADALPPGLERTVSQASPPSVDEAPPTPASSDLSGSTLQTPPAAPSASPLSRPDEAEADIEQTDAAPSPEPTAAAAEAPTDEVEEAATPEPTPVELEPTVTPPPPEPTASATEAPTDKVKDAATPESSPLEPLPPPGFVWGGTF